MFGFALWDAPRRRLVLSRDRLGIKPLYYTVHRDRLIFASEIKAILEVEGIERRIDYDALDAYLSLRYVPGPKTMFRDIFKLQPGHTLVVQSGRIEVRPYWDVTFSEEPRNERQVMEEFETLLFEVCRSHLMSEVPYGVFLSGGVDSSSIAAVLRAILKDRVTTFTVGYDEAEGINEFDYARMVSQHVGTRHHELALPTKDFADWIPRLVWHLDEPVGDPACIPLYFLARYAKERATVLHSGEGADEILAGYSIYKKMEVVNRFFSGPLSLLGQIVGRGVSPLCGQGKLARYLRLFAQPLDERYRGVSGHFLSRFKHELIKGGALPDPGGSSLLAETFRDYYSRVGPARNLNKMLYVDTHTWLPDDLLVKADKMTMAASVELRVPFLDHRLVEFAARLPVSYKLRRGQTKYLLKKVMERYLPPEVIYRSKKGFPVPIAQWFRNGLHELASDTLLSPHAKVGAYLSRDCIEKMLLWHKSERSDLSDELWGLLVLEYWFREFHVQP
jgi:asparagine synthase (glutamine-hydrolysing)